MVMKISFSKGIAETYSLYDERSFQHCWDYCICLPTEDYLRKEREIEQERDREFMEGLDAAKVKYGITEPIGLPESDPPPFNSLSLGEASVQLSMPQTCPTSSACENFRCPRQHTRHRNPPRCICRARVKPGGFGWPSCGVQARRYPFGGRKREIQEDMCPCNGTYVSRKCCNVDDGLVWEAPEFKLGEMIEDEV
jgi:hypothetical protein